MATGQPALFGAQRLATLSAQFLPPTDAAIPDFGADGFGSAAPPLPPGAPPLQAPRLGVSIFDTLADQIVDGLAAPGPAPATPLTLDGAS